MNNGKRKILVIDDEMNIIKLIKMNLEMNGFQAEYGLTGKEAIDLAKSKKPDLMIVDLMLPDMDGFEVCRSIRLDNKLKNIPIIILTAKVEETDKVIGLELGADDYITKPFSVRELIARIKAVLRRTSNNQEDISIFNNTVIVKDLTLDFDKHSVTKGNERIDLTYMEFKLLKILIENRGNVLSRDKILKILGGENTSTDPRTIDVHIRNLRKKLHLSKEDSYIETVRGIGYRFK